MTVCMVISLLKIPYVHRIYRYMYGSSQPYICTSAGHTDRHGRNTPRHKGITPCRVLTHGWLGQHGLDGHGGRELAVQGKVPQAALQQFRDDLSRSTDRHTSLRWLGDSSCLFFTSWKQYKSVTVFILLLEFFTLCICSKRLQVWFDRFDSTCSHFVFSKGTHY